MVGFDLRANPGPPRKGAASARVRVFLRAAPALVCGASCSERGEGEERRQCIVLASE